MVFAGSIKFPFRELIRSHDGSFQSFNFRAYGAKIWATMRPILRDGAPVIFKRPAVRGVHKFLRSRCFASGDEAP